MWSKDARSGQETSGRDDDPRIWHGKRPLVSGAALSLDDLAVELPLLTVRLPIPLAVTAFGVTAGADG
jgi:hypothetical protein